ncbi:MAG: hypothetical protein QOF70_3906 [Acetobacteraceae bacterium]|nr:hypothetical protein [Acetobacteraceae bacterium]
MPMNSAPQLLSGARRRSGRSMDLLDYVLFMPGIWLASMLGISFRLIGPAFVVVPTGFCLIYAILRRVKPPRVLGLYFGLCLVVAGLSNYQIFPTSWQVHFLQDAIMRQLAPLSGFFAVTWASKAYFRRRLFYGDVFSGAPLIVTLSLFVAPAVMIQQGVGYEGDYSPFAVIALAGGFINNMLIAFFFIAGAIFFTRDWRRYAALAFVLLTAATSHFAQFRLMTVITLAALVGLPGRRVAVGAVAILISLYAIGMNFIPEAMVTDPNDGLRLQLVFDTLVSAADTHGIGIGYGMESVRWRYQFPNMADFTFLPDPATMTHSRMLEALSTGVENSFASALLRTGVVGCLLLVVAILAAFPPRNLPRDVRNHAAVIFAMIFITCFVNPALESPLQAIGVGFGYGYLLALRARSRVCTPEITWFGKPVWSRTGPLGSHRGPAILASGLDAK